MDLSTFDICIFLVFILAVVSLGIFKSRQEKTSEGYFLAGRGLSWWLIGFSLIAANISTEQFVGMSGSAAGTVGLAIASYEWMAAVTLVIVAFFFLPKFLRSGIFTIPEFLEYRYNELSRTLMSLFTMVIYVGVTIAAVIYSGALTINTLFAGKLLFGAIEVNVVTGSWIIGIIAAVYVASGGLKACAWADLLQGSALIIGGAIVAILAFAKLGVTPVAELASNIDPGDLSDTAGGVKKFMALNRDKLHMVLPRDNPDVPWTALVVGLWIPNFYYWGLNQYICQRALGSKSLSQGQKGVVFAAALKLIIPFIIVVPGLMAFNLFSADMAEEAAKDSEILKDNEAVLALYEELKTDNPESHYVLFCFDKGWEERNALKAAELRAHNVRIEAEARAAGKKIEKENLLGYKYDTAFALLIGKLIPFGVGLQGFMLAAILGAVVSSLASMLNAASTIFTMDLYRKYMHKGASQAVLVLVGRICVGVFVVLGCLISPLLDDPEFGGIFKYIQEFQGFISPGILAVFVFGLIVKRAPPLCGVVGLLLNPPMYGLMKLLLPGLAFLDRMAVSFFCVLIVMGIITAFRPMDKPAVLPRKTDLDLEPSSLAKVFGVMVIVVTLVLYAFFW
jgi:SSS family solute:Na+ symporter